MGFSAGGGFASTLMTYDPERTIAVGIYGARYNFDVFTRPGGPAGPFAVHLGIPSVLITGEMEKLNDPGVDGRYKVDEVFVSHRPKGRVVVNFGDRPFVRGTMEAVLPRSFAIDRPLPGN